ncbi:MAG: N-acetylglucosamine-6-phosphate deacetylase [Actinopolymorphaceae bacterium]
MSSPEQPVGRRPAEVAGRNPATGRWTVVRIDGGHIAEITSGSGSPTGAEDADVWLSAGFVDLQVNGYGGFDANAAEDDAGPEAVVGLVHALFAVGVTTVVPTVVTAAESHIVACLRRIVAARALDPLVRHAIPFVHVEGPHLSGEDGPRGVHPAAHVRPPDVAEFTRWQAACDGLVGMVTLSPHFAGSPAYISDLVARGIRVSVGHTHAEPEQIRASAEAGASLSTHLGNGAHAVLARHPNYVWAQLAEDRLAAGFIADGHHLPADTLTAMLRAKGLSRSFLVSDATTLAGSPPGVYRTPVGGEVELSAEGRLSHVGTPYLAGAARSITDGVAHVAELGPFSLGEAVGLATTTPGAIVGGRGTLDVGAPADLVRFHWNAGKAGLTVQDVVVAGAPVPTRS